MNKRVSLLILLIVAVLLASCSFPIDIVPDKESAEVSGEAIFHFIDVGQGDCILIQGGGKNILVDSGPSQNSHKLFAYLKDIGIKRLDYFIGTHPHEDHLGGATSVAGSIDVGKIFLNGEQSPGYFFENFVNIISEKNIPVEIPVNDCIYKLGPFSIKFLSPLYDYGDTNYNSLVFTIQFGDIKALFTGDAERIVEADLLKNNVTIDADILKVPHHGSRNASSLSFLNEVSPAISVIQCGEGNSYGHPHDEAFDRLEKVSAEVFRTDKDGTVILRTDGKTITTLSGDEFDKTDSSEVELIYIGNKKSRTFHCETCPNLPGEKNSIIFSSRESALNAGFKVCGNCKP